MDNVFMYTVVAQGDAANETQLRHKLLRSPGVVSADVSKTEGRVYVRGLGVNEQVIAQVIEQSGYSVISSNISG